MGVFTTLKNIDAGFLFDKGFRKDMRNNRMFKLDFFKKVKMFDQTPQQLVATIQYNIIDKSIMIYYYGISRAPQLINNVCVEADMLLWMNEVKETCNIK